MAEVAEYTMAGGNLHPDPRDVVLSTTELLEHVLMCLTPSKLLVVQRVSRRFRDCIATSPALQQKILYKSSGSKPQQWLAVSYLDPDGRLRSFFTTTAAKLDELEILPELETQLCTPLKLCPALTTRFSDMLQYPPAEAVCRLVSPRTRPTDTVDYATAGSWENMFLTDPPCTEATMQMQWERGGEVDLVSVYHQIKDQAGVKLGMLRKLPSMRGGLHVWTGGPYPRGHGFTTDYPTAEEAMAYITKKKGGSFKLKFVWIHCEDSTFTEHVAYPTATDWSEMESAMSHMGTAKDSSTVPRTTETVY